MPETDSDDTTNREREAVALVVMGVSGVGKSTVGRLLAERLGWPFYDADDFHPPENVEKMRSGRPLDDADRWVWLDALRALIEEQTAAGRSIVLACSALKESYRDVLRTDAEGRRDPSVVVVYLEASRQVVQERIQARTGHFMNPLLLESQFATLEAPEQAIVVDAGGTPAEIVEAIADEFETRVYETRRRGDAGTR